MVQFSYKNGKSYVGSVLSVAAGSQVSFGLNENYILVKTNDILSGTEIPCVFKIPIADPLNAISL